MRHIIEINEETGVITIRPTLGFDGPRYLGTPVPAKTPTPEERADTERFDKITKELLSYVFEKMATERGLSSDDKAFFRRMAEKRG